MDADRPLAVPDIVEAVEGLGLAGAVACIHVSLRSFPRLEDGPATLIDGLVAAGVTVIIPTMANDTFAIPAPADDRPAQNGIDYAAKDAAAAASPWPGMSDLYSVDRTDTDAGLGATPAHVAARPDRVRCRLSPGAFSGVGNLAAPIIGAEVPEDTFGPLRAVADHDGWVVLIGVGLTRMTLLHLAELEAGRRPFIRWTRGPDGAPVRSRGGGCSLGFERLGAALAPIERSTTVGASRWGAFPARGVLERAAAAIRATPEITHCPDPSCLECVDAVAGGPVA
jgi:aminoglycoside 3-N-acetyltransferase